MMTFKITLDKWATGRLSAEVTENPIGYDSHAKAIYFPLVQRSQEASGSVLVYQLRSVSELQRYLFDSLVFLVAAR